MNRAVGALNEQLGEAALGLARSVYTFVKTSFCDRRLELFPRSPSRSSSRSSASSSSPRFSCAPPLPPAVWPRTSSPSRWPQPASPSSRWETGRLFGTWGGLGGWYAWSWLPWLAVAADDLLAHRSEGTRWFLFAAVSAFVVAADVGFALAAARLYG